MTASSIVKASRPSSWNVVLAFALLFAGWASAVPASETELDRVFPRSTLQIATPDARLHTFRIWVAADDALRARGLMYVKKLADDAGMLFLYPQPQRISMWMKNTYIPLDMLFVRADGRIDSIVEHTTPMSLDTIQSAADVVAVIEVNAGTAARLKIQPGARVMHPAFDRR